MDILHRLAHFKDGTLAMTRKWNQSENKCREATLNPFFNAGEIKILCIFNGKIDVFIYCLSNKGRGY